MSYDVAALAGRAKAAARVLALADTETKNRALLAAAAALEQDSAAILAENEKDLAAGRAGGLSEALLDRLALSAERIAGMAGGLRAVAALPDPVGRVLEESDRPNGLHLTKRTVPIGVIAVIYEARPNVTADSAALCLKSGNAVILRGGKEAIRSNMAVAATLRRAIASAGLPGDCVQLVEDTNRETATALMQLNGGVDLLIPRGGAGLIQSVVRNATVPVIETGAGTCHTYVDKDADLSMAAEILYNAKTSRPSVCNACECLLVHEAVARDFLPLAEEKLRKKGVTLRADETCYPLLRQAEHASEEDWGKEYNDYILAIRAVKDVEEAIAFIGRCGTGHSECIVTENEATAEKFLREVDAAAVYVNASTRFTDGGEFGLGAEIGISTQKLHARGPLGLRELTSYKYEVRGKGQVR